MQKGEVLYETHQTPIGFQSTVRLPCLPGEWSELAWAGEVASQQKQAEQNAAKEALEAVNSNLESIRALLPQPQTKPPSGKSGGWMMDGKGWGCMGPKGKSKGWGYWGKGMMGMGMGMSGWGGGCGGCGGPEMDQAMFGGKGGKAGTSAANLPRTRITEVAITGEIVEWKGKYGWLQPHTQLDHPMARKRAGRIFMSQKDVTGSVELELGTMVTFHVYEDPTGLGAEDVNTF